MIAFWAVIGLGWLMTRDDRPKMSDTEMRTIMAKHRAEERQRCIDNINKSAPLMPKDMQKYAYEALSKC